MFLFAKATSLGSGVIKMGNGSFSKIANHIPYTPLPPPKGDVFVCKETIAGPLIAEIKRAYGDNRRGLPLP